MTIDQLLVEVEPVAWIVKRDLMTQEYVTDRSLADLLSTIEDNDVRPVYSRNQVLALLTAEREAREKAEAERDQSNRRWAEVCADFVALQKAIVGDSGLSAILRVDQLKEAEARLKEAGAVIAPFASFDTEDFPDSMRLFEDDPNLSMGHLRAAAKFMEAKDGK